MQVLYQTEAVLYSHAVIFHSLKLYSEEQKLCTLIMSCLSICHCMDCAFFVVIFKTSLPNPSHRGLF